MKPLTLLMLLFMCCSFSLQTASSQHKSNSQSLAVPMGTFGYWDYQSSGSMLTIEQDSLQPLNYHAIYKVSDSVLSTPIQRIHYLFSDDGGYTWDDLGEVPSAANSSGFASLALKPDGSAVIAVVTGGALKIFIDLLPGGGTFTPFTAPAPLHTSPKILIMGNMLYLFAMNSSYANIDMIKFNLQNSQWSTWTNITTDISDDAISQRFQAAKNFPNKLGVVWMNDSNVVKYRESTDNGNTFGSINTIFTREITGADTVRAFRHLDMIYFNNLPAIAFDGIARILPAGGQEGIRKYYHNPKIYFWSPTWGIKTVVDTSRHWATPGRNFMCSMGAMWTPISGPSIGSSSSNIYIAYSVASTHAPFGNYWYDSDIYAAYSGNGGGYWYGAYFGNNDPQHDDRYVCVLKKNNNAPYYSFGVMYQKDKFPGSYRLGDTTAITRAYPEFRFVYFWINKLEQNGNAPDKFVLHQNYPNPFNPVTKIKFSIPPYKGGKGDVLLFIYDVLGREIATVVNEQLKPGTYEVDWDGTNYPSGVYFYKLIADDFSETKRMVLVK